MTMLIHYVRQTHEPFNGQIYAGAKGLSHSNVVIGTWPSISVLSTGPDFSLLYQM